MRILHVTDCYLPLLGGIEVQVRQLALHQRAAGHDVRILTATPRERGGHGLSQEDDDGVRVYRMAARMPAGVPVHPWPVPHARRLLTRLRPDVVHLHMGGVTPSTQAVMPLVGRLGIPAVVTVHSVWSPRTAVPFYAALDRLLGWSGWPLTLTAVSELAARPVRRAARPGTEVHVLRNGVDVMEWRRPPLPRASSAVHAVTAGRFAPRKRMMPLLEALRRAGELLPDDALEVTIAGAGPQLGDAEAFLAEHGMTGWVHLPGRLSRADLIELYRRADVYLAPGVQDAFSVAVQEAQAAGLAIVSRAQSGAAELLTEGVDGLLADDDAALAHQLARLVTDRALLGRITAHNRTVPPTTTWATVLGATEDMYRRAGA
ncbi:glycosyltransferase family 4 protein [Georgenia sp. MJ206]|uniref:glycosyltransferase family 4 protein n=1 Tax=Georgenia wangjunii TaxID=3117730 RepID=UPI002F26D0FF